MILCIGNKRKNTYVKRINKLVCVLVLLLVCVISTVRLEAAERTDDTDVTNTASFSTDVIYQIVTDRFFDGNPSNNPSGDLFDPFDLRKYHGGDWAGITKKLQEGYFKDLGVSALWISSPVENIETIDPSNGCSSYHGYWAKDFFRTNPYFGSKEEFQMMIDTAHSNGIKVIIDFAPNHTSTAEYGSMVFPENGALYRNGMYIGGFKTDQGRIFNHESWTDFSSYENGIYHSMYGLADLNQQNEEVDKYLKEAIQMWLDMGVDGIRVDAVKHMPFGWQKNWLSTIYSHKPVFTFGEWFAGGTDSDYTMNKFANESGMSLLDFRFANAIRDTLGERKKTMVDLYHTMLDTCYEYEEVNDQVTFIDNHDMSRFLTLAGNNRHALESAYVVLLTSRGIPTIYYGSEQYATGNTDPYNRGDMKAFNKNVRSFQVIKSLAPLRKMNPAVAYGSTRERWMNEDILIYERQFGKSVVVTAVNRNQFKSADIYGIYTNLAQGVYEDILHGVLNGNRIEVGNDGAVTPFRLGAGACAVWQYTETEQKPLLGNVDPMMGITGNTITVTGRGFGKTIGKVKFGTKEAKVLSWSDSQIKLKVPAIEAGKYTLRVEDALGQISNLYIGFEKLTGPQVCVRLKVNNAYTDMGSNVYVVGNIYELGNWDHTKAIGPMFHATDTIGVYPDWFYDINLPAGSTVEYKFIKKDRFGNVTWEGGVNHKITIPKEGTYYAEVAWQQ